MRWASKEDELRDALKIKTAEWTAMMKENARLRQRVEELERLLDQEEPRWRDLTQRAEAAEAKLADYANTLAEEANQHRDTKAKFAALREENARLKELGSVNSALRLQDERQELVKTKLALTRERDEAREEVARLKEDITTLKNVLRGEEAKQKQWTKRHLEMQNDCIRMARERDEAKAARHVKPLLDALENEHKAGWRTEHPSRCYTCRLLAAWKDNL